MSLKKIVLAAVGGVVVLAGLIATGRVTVPQAAMDGTRPKSQETEQAKPSLAPPPAVTVARVGRQAFVETVLVTGSLVAREEILVGPEVEGLRVAEVLAEEGQRVKKGQPLARLVSDTLEAQLAQNTAAVARAEAGIAQARSAISSAEARMVEAENAYKRAEPLTKSGYLSESNMDQRESARRTAEAALRSAQDGLKVAEAEKAQVEAQRRELVWRRGRTEIRAPADGLISRRVARIGSYATGVGEPMFRIVAKGELELDAEVPESRLHLVKAGQKVRIEVAGAAAVEGVVRLVSPEIDKSTRLGRVRVFIGDEAGLRVGAFARGRIATAKSRGLSVPSTAVLYDARGASVQVVVDGKVVTRRVEIGLGDGGRSEVVAGLEEGEMVVARSGTFLRDGDAVRPVLPSPATAREAG